MLISGKKTVLLAMFCLLGASGVRAQHIDIPLGHWVYPFLERLETKHLIEPEGYTKPYSRRQVVSLLLQLKKGDQQNKLTPLETRQLVLLEEELQEEFAREGEGKREPSWRAFDRPWFSWQRDNNYFQADYITRLKVFFDTGSSPLLITSSGGEAWGYLQDKVGYYFYGADNKKKGSSLDHIQNESLVPWQEDKIIGFSAIVEDQTARYFDRTRAYLSFNFPWFNLLFGRGQNQWGPGQFNNLTLSGEAAELDHLKLTARYGRIRFTSIHAKCFEDLLDTARTTYYNQKRRRVYREKYLAAHRAEITFPKNIVLGVNEVLLYGDRGIEFAYLVPTTFYWSVEHSLRDQDNATLSADISIRAIPNLHLYGELFIDDMSTDSLYSNWYGNKWGTVVGLHYCDPPFVPNLDLNVEYTRVEPWVYTHWTEISKYTHQGFPLGFRLGPNSDNLFIKTGYQFTPSIAGAIMVSRERKGENYYSSDSLYHNIGGDIHDGHDTVDPLTKTFLKDGERTEKLIIGGEMTFRSYYKVLDKPYFNVLRDLSLTLGYYWVEQKNVLTGDDIFSRWNQQDQRFSVIGKYHFY